MDIIKKFLLSSSAAINAAVQTWEILEKQEEVTRLLVAKQGEVSPIGFKVENIASPLDSA
jgi:hypothetical protein